MYLPTLIKECSQFLEESNKLPLLKNLPIHGDGFRKVKVRKKNANNIFIEAFNKSFSEHKNIFNRSIFANGNKSFIPTENKIQEPFYIFPIDGYQFIYNPVVTNAFTEYKQDIEKLTKTVSQDSVIDIFSKVIKQSYLSENLSAGIKIGSEIIIYKAQHYYAIRKTLLDDYNSLS